MLHIPPTNCLLITAKQEPYKKAYLLTKTMFHHATTCRSVTTLHKCNQTIIFSMFAIFAVAGATFALRPFRMYGFTACGSSAHCTCSCQQLRQKGFTAYGGLRETMDHHLTLSAAANN